MHIVTVTIFFTSSSTLDNVVGGLTSVPGRGVVRKGGLFWNSIYNSLAHATVRSSLKYRCKDGTKKSSGRLRSEYILRSSGTSFSSSVSDMLSTRPKNFHVYDPGASGVSDSTAQHPVAMPHGPPAKRYGAGRKAGEREGPGPRATLPACAL